MTRAGMAASRCPEHPQGKHRMVVFKRSKFSPKMIMRCTRCITFTSYWC